MALRTSVPRSALHAVGLVLLGLKLLTVTLAFDPMSASAFALPKATASRATEYALVVVSTVYVWRHWRAFAWRPSAYALGAYIAASVLATSLAVDQRLALFGSYDRRLGLTSILDGAVTAVAVSLFVRSPRELLVLGAAVASAVLVVLAYFAAQLGGLDPFRWTDLNRASTLGNTTVLAGFLVTLIAAAATAAVAGWGTLSKSRRSVVALVLGMSALAVITVTARGAILALPAAAAAAVLLGTRVAGRRITPRARLSLVATTALGLVALIVSPAGPRLLALANGGDLSTSERALIYASAVEAVRQRPLLGSGPDTFVAVYPSVRSPSISVIAGPAHIQTSEHSWLLHEAVGTGVLGLAPLLAVILLTLIDGWRRAPQGGGIIPALGVAMVVTFLVQGAVSTQHIATEMLFWAGVGLIGMVRVDWPAVGQRQRRDQSGWQFADGRAAVAAVLLGLAASTTVLPGFQAGREIHASQRAGSGNRQATAVDHLERAVDLDPGRAEHWNALGIALSGDSTKRGLRAFLRASELAPYDPALLLNLAREEFVLGQADAALRRRAADHARQAAAIDRNSPVTLRRAVEILYAVGDTSSAAELIERLAAIFPLTQADLPWAAEIYEAAGKRAATIATLESLGRLRWPDGRYPDDWRLRMARLYLDQGDPVAADLIAPRARVTIITRCATGCLVVEFNTFVELRTDPSSASMLNLANYRVSGAALPPGTTVDLLSRYRTRILLPHGTDVPRGSDLQVSGVMDVIGRPMDPSSVVVP